MYIYITTTSKMCVKQIHIYKNMNNKLDQKHITDFLMKNILGYFNYFIYVMEIMHASHHNRIRL